MGTNNTGSRGSSTGQGGGSTNANSPPAGWGHRGGHSAHPTWCGAGAGGGAGGVGGDGSGGSGGAEVSGNGGPGLTMSIQGPSGVWAGGGGGGMEGSGGHPLEVKSRTGGGGRGGYSTQIPSPRPNWWHCKHWRWWRWHNVYCNQVVVLLVETGIVIVAYTTS